MPEKKHDNLISRTRSICPECDEIIYASIVERDGGVYQVKSCPEHGDFDFFLHGDPGFYLRCAKDTTKTPEEFMNCNIAGCLSCKRHMDYVKTIMIDVTERCNLDCTACFTNTHTRKSREPSIEDITSRLAGWKHRPTVLLSGGEPTLREDLPELIRAITDMGFVVKVASNAIKLRDPEYAARLHEAGLGWVLFQFDGFSDEIYKKTRGRELLDIKYEALDVLGKSGIKVCLACMVVKGINDGELGRMVEFMMKSDYIMHMGCTVLSCVGRDSFAEEHFTTAQDVLNAVEKGTAGRITVEDFMHTRRIGNTLFKLTGNRDFQQKSCFHTLLLHKRGDSFFPVNRYFKPLTAAANPGGFLDLAKLVGRLRHWDAITMTGNVKLFTVEEFRAHDTIDLVEANRCNKVYMSDSGYIPPCIYNTKYRPLSWRCGEPSEKT